MSVEPPPSNPDQFHGDQSQYPQWYIQQQLQSNSLPNFQQWRKQPPQQPRKDHTLHSIFIICAVILVAIFAFAIGAATTNHGTPTMSTTPDNQGTQASAQLTADAANQSTDQPTQVAVTPTPTFLTFGDGTFQVGKEIQPGTYRTQSGSSGCYYARLSGFGGTLGEIIENNLTDNPAIVTIAKTDKGFESENCGTWTQDLSQITTSKTTFDDGMYFVGTDIEPGTYKNSGSSGCYYARLSGFSGSIEDIIANNNVDTSAIVTISASDKGFQSTNCGTWTKQ